MENVSEAIVDILVAHGFGTEGGSGGEWSISKNSEPPGPDETITVYDLDSTSTKFHNKKHGFTRSPFQVRVRGRNYDEVQNMLEDIEEVLDRYGSFSRGDVWYDNIVKEGDRVPMRGKVKDPKERHIWVQNYVAFRERRG